MRRTYEVVTRILHDTGGQFSRGEVSDRPCPAILVGPNAVDARHYQVEFYHTRTPSMLPKKSHTDKPPYRLPLMAEVRAVPKNGFAVVSTFSGCGGSCLGFRMAGFETLWANEFIPAARATYQANHPGVILDPRDIRTVRPQEILKAIGRRKGEIDVLEGSPPCASFSTAGKRNHHWGQVKKYSDTHQRVDDLFFEFARILQGLKPKVFVAENVSGLVKGVAKGYFKLILQALRDCGYVVEARLLDAQWLGVPQARQRLIFIGVRHDLALRPAFPRPLTYRYSVRDAIPWVTRVSGRTGPHFRRVDSEVDQPFNAVVVSDPDQTRYEVQAVSQTDISRHAIGKEWDRLAPGQKGKYLNLVKPRLDRPCPTVTQTGGKRGAASVVHPTQRRKFTIAELKRICAFPEDFLLTRTYAQQWERLGRAVPPLMMFHVAQTIREEMLCKLPKK